MDTIFALATAQGKAGVAVIRISGSQSFELSTILCGKLPLDRKMGVRSIRANDGTLLDQALVLLFPENQSFTGEATVELQLHGSIAVVRAVLAAISDTGLARVAEPGEFTRRALLNERLDLTQVEGLSDLIEAETEVQRREAMRSFDGALRDMIEGLRANLIRAAALLEATIDFADEEVPENVYPEVENLLKDATKTISSEISRSGAAQSVRKGFEVAIVGPPNVGKSTLLNTLAGREAAITSEIAGTTRDIVEVRMDIQGLPVTFLDTAGVRETDDPIEKLGVARAVERAKAAELRVILLERPDADPIMPPCNGDIVVSTKHDIYGVGISALNGTGLNELLSEISDRLGDLTADIGLISRERDRIALSESYSRLCLVQENLLHMSSELLTAEIYGAVQSLGAVIGRVGVEDVLDEIFASFCLGK